MSVTVLLLSEGRIQDLFLEGGGGQDFEICRNIMAGYAVDTASCGDGVGGLVPLPLGVLGATPRFFF